MKSSVVSVNRHVVSVSLFRTMYWCLLTCLRSDAKSVALVLSLYSLYSRFNSVLRLQRNSKEQEIVSVRKSYFRPRLEGLKI